VVSLPDLAHLPATVNSAPDLLELVLTLVVVVVVVLLILDLTTASGSTPVTVTIVTTLMPILMLDSPVFNLSVDLLVPSVSLVPLTPRVLDPKPVSVSSTLAVAPEALLSSPLMSVARLSPVPRKETSLFPDMVVSLTAPTPLSTVPPSVRRSALVDVWVEVLALTVFVLATRVPRVRIVLSSPK